MQVSLSINGEEGGRPVIPGVQVGDLGGGGMAAVIAILAALQQRNTTGKGDFCDVSMTDGVVSWLSIHASEFFATERVPEAERMHLNGAYPCYRIYPAADGWLTVGALEPQFWSRLCELIERPDLLGDAFAMGDRRNEVIEELSNLFKTKTRAEWMQMLGDEDVCVGPVNDFSEAFADEQVLAREMVVEGEVPGAGTVKMLGNPIKLAGDSGKVVRKPPPQMGEHTDQILGEIGLTGDDLDKLRVAGAI